MSPGVESVSTRPTGVTMRTDEEFLAYNQGIIA